MWEVYITYILGGRKSWERITVTTEWATDATTAVGYALRDFYSTYQDRLVVDTVAFEEGGDFGIAVYAPDAMRQVPRSEYKE